MLFPQDENEEPAAQPSYDDQRHPPFPPIMQDPFAASTRTVLVVDPSSAVRDFIQSTLEQEHFHIIFAYNDVSALASIAAYHPHLILLSIQLEGVDGFHLCQIIRKIPHLDRLPVILLGQRKSTFDTMRGRLSGSTDLLIKPLDAHQLVLMVKRYLSE